MAIRYEERNGRRYAYRCTSVRVPGRKNPVSRKEYLGVVDPETGLIVPKKVPADSGRLFLAEGSARVLDYGDSVIAMRVCERLGIQRDLSAVYGTRASEILCLAISQAIAPIPFMDTHITMDSKYIREAVGLDDRDFSPKRMTELVREIGEDSDAMERFFSRRASACAGPPIAFVMTLRSVNMDLDSLSDRLSDSDWESRRHLRVGMAAGPDGTPVAFDVFPRSESDIDALEGFLGDMERIVGGCTLVLDRGLESASNVLRMLDSGIGFIMPCRDTSKAARRLLTEFAPDVDDPELLRVHAGHGYRVAERSLGILENADGGASYVTDGDPEFASCAHRVKAFVCFDQRRHDEDERRLRRALRDTVRDLDGKRFDDPRKAFAERAGSAGNFLEYTVEDGVMRVGVRTNAVTFYCNRAGMFIMLSSGPGWEEVMSAYDARDWVDVAFNVSKTDLNGKRARRDPVRARGRLFVKFLAMMIRLGMHSVLDSSRLKGMSVDTMLATAATYKVIDDGTVRVRSVKSRQVDAILEVFGIRDVMSSGEDGEGEECSSILD